MKKYLIFVYGEFSDNDIKRITNNIAPITEGKAFKFLYTQDHIIFHFESSFEMEFIQEFILDTIKDECLMYFMTEYNDSLSYYIPADSGEYLFNLSSIENNDMVVSGTNIVDAYSKEEEVDDEEEDDDDEDISEIDAIMIMQRLKKDLRRPTLDEILDKISEEGKESLTQYEQAILDKYSEKL